MGKFIDMTNKKYGRLTVISNSGKSKTGAYKWNCICDCGNKHTVSGVYLRNGYVRSCGCLHSPGEEEYLKKLEARLLKYSKMVGQCREWTVRNRTTGFGYGYINFRKKQIMAHRASWIVWRGKIPKGMFVCHTCDNPLCINPDHLFLGTHKDNMKDMVLKNRQNNSQKGSIGEKNGSSMLKESDISEILEMFYFQKLNQSEIARYFCITPASIRNILIGKTWKNIKREIKITKKFMFYRDYEKICKESIENEKGELIWSQPNENI